MGNRSEADMQRDIIKIAYYHYKLGMNQNEIADKLQVSRQKVSRLLKRAIDENVVRIEVLGYNGSHVELENRLESMYGLQEVIVKDTGSQLGEAVNTYLDRVLVDGFNVGITFGNTLAQMVEASNRPQRRENVSVVQLLGCMNGNNITGRMDILTNQVAAMLNGSVHILYVPGIIENPELKQLFMSESKCMEVVKKYKKLDIAFVGIGAPTEDSVVTQMGFLSMQEYEILKKKGCVGDVALRFIDDQGRVVDPEFNNKVTGIELLDYMSIPLRVGISYGTIKVKPLVGAVRGKYINVLITDVATAKEMLTYGP